MCEHAGKAPFFSALPSTTKCSAAQRSDWMAAISINAVRFGMMHVSVCLCKIGSLSTSPEESGYLYNFVGYECFEGSCKLSEMTIIVHSMSICVDVRKVRDNRLQATTV